MGIWLGRDEYRWMDWWMDGWMDAQSLRTVWMDGWMDRIGSYEWKDIDGRMDGWIVH